MRTCAASAVLALAWPPPAFAGASPTAKEVAAKARELAESEIKDGPAAGISILVAHKGKVLLATGYGYADIEHKIPATEHTVYRLGSLSKQFTAAATMQLVDKGLVKLDESIRAYLPDYPAVGQKVTVRHLLNHTSGLAEYTTLGEFWNHKNDELQHSEVLRWFASRDLRFTPGDQYSYCNAGYFVLGLIIERVSGESFAEYVQREIIEPLKLRETYYAGIRRTIPNGALGYSREKNNLVPAKKQNLDLIFSVGAMTSTVLDMYAFHKALRAGILVTPESYAIMTVPAWLNDGSFTEYGMGFHVNNWGGHVALRHGGLVHGFKTCYYYYPADDLTIIILMNTEQSEYRPIQSGIARMFIPDLGAGADYE